MIPSEKAKYYLNLTSSKFMALNENINKPTFHIASSYEKYLTNNFKRKCSIDELFLTFSRGFIIGERGAGKTWALNYLGTSTPVYKSKTVIYISFVAILNNKIGVEEYIRTRINASGKYFDEVIICIDDVEENSDETLYYELADFLNKYFKLSVLIAITPSFLSSNQDLMRIRDMHFASILILRQEPIEELDSDTNLKEKAPNKLKNSGEKVRNDVPFAEDSYDIINKSFVFTIFPQTQFWRFGIRMSKITKINFDLGNPNRHSSPAYRDIHVSTGSLLNGWTAPEKLELNQYYIPNRNHVLSRCTTYKPLTPVTFRVTHLADDKVVEIAIKSQVCEEYITRIPFDEFRFFKIFAWADLIDFELDFILEVIPLGEDTAKLIEGKYTPPDKWYITEDDVGVIGVQDLAGILGNLLKNLKQADKGKMVGIFGPWGRGKTFLVDHTWKLLEQDVDKPFIRINFHAWKYQDTPASWAYLYETFAEEYFRSDKKTAWSRWWDKLFKKIDLNWKREGPAPFLFLLLSIGVTVLCFIFGEKLDEVKRFFVFFGVISITTLQVFRLIKNRVSEKAKELFDKYYTKVSFSNLLGTQAEIQRELRVLLQQWLKEKTLLDQEKASENNPFSNKKTVGFIDKRILLFVDDIDRCKEDRIMEIIDALRIMLEDDEISKRVVVVAAIDERVLKRAIKCKYHDILSKDCEIGSDSDNLKKISGNITREYMDKLFLSGISLGSLSESERVKILGKYIRGRIAPRNNIEAGNEMTEGDAGSGNQTTKEASLMNKEKQNIGDSTFTNNNSEKPSQPSEAILKLDDIKYDLTKDEEEHLAFLMSFCVEFTPRQIRIFYYRYLLGRNILKLRYEKSGKHLTRSMLEKLAQLILNFSIEKDSEALKKAKTKAYDKDGTLASVEIFKSNVAFDKTELLDYLETIETVVSY